MTAPLAMGIGNGPLAVLLAEDSQVTQDLLSLLLRQRGHRVDIVDDGEKALAALQSRSYDIALMDFHLPKMDGLRAVVNFKSMAGDTTKPPRFIGISADVQGLLAHPDNCENFDLVISKPIDIIHLCNIVENFDNYMAWTRCNAADSGLSQETPVMADHSGSETQESSESSVGEGEGERHKAKRVTIERGITLMTLNNGKAYDCRVLDLSLSGAALEVEVRPALGEYVQVGRTKGRIVRHTNDGVSVEFMNVATPKLTKRPER